MVSRWPGEVRALGRERPPDLPTEILGARIRLLTCLLAAQADGELGQA